MVEFSFQLNDEDKIHKGVTKYILRKALWDILPEEIINRQDKKAFVTPGETKWLKGPLKSLLDFDFKNVDFINQPLVDKTLRQYLKNGSNNQIVWRLAALNHWLKKL